MRPYQTVQSLRRSITTMLNIGLASFFILLVALFLYYKYKGKPTPMEKMLKERDKALHSLSYKNYQDAKRLESDKYNWASSMGKRIRQRLNLRL